MGHRNRQQSVPQPLPRANSVQGAATTAAVGNWKTATGPAVVAAASGNLLASDVSFTPKSGGAIKIAWTTSGAASSGTETVSFSPTIGGVGTQTFTSSPGTDAGHNVASSGTMVVTGLTVGTAVNVNVAFTAVGGTFATGSQATRVLVEELLGAGS